MTIRIKLHPIIQKCPYCTRSFKYSNTWVKHLKLKHPKEYQEMLKNATRN